MKQIKEEHRHRSKMTVLLTKAKSKVSRTFHDPFSVDLSLGSKCCNMEKTFNRSFHKSNSSCFDLVSVTSQLSHVMFVVAFLMNNSRDFDTSSNHLDSSASLVSMLWTKFTEFLSDRVKCEYFFAVVFVCFVAECSVTGRRPLSDWIERQPVGRWTVVVSRSDWLVTNMGNVWQYSATEDAIMVFVPSLLHQQYINTVPAVGTQPCFTLRQQSLLSEILSRSCTRFFVRLLLIFEFRDLFWDCLYVSSSVAALQWMWQLGGETDSSCMIVLLVHLTLWRLLLPYGYSYKASCAMKTVLRLRSRNSKNLPMADLTL